MVDEKEEDARVKLEQSPFPTGSLLFKAAEVVERLGALTEIKLEVYFNDKSEDDPVHKLEEFLGEPFVFSVITVEETWRQFSGICTSAQRLGFLNGHWTYALTLRPKLWLLTLRKDSRIYQEMTAEDIIRDVLQRANVNDHVEWKVTASFRTREYCVQYRETDFDFISRLMEEEGMYYFFKTEGGVQKTIIIDSSGRHEDIEGVPADPSNNIAAKTVQFLDKHAEFRRRRDHVQEFKAAEQILTGKVTLDDYDFTKPQSDLTSIKSMPTGVHDYKSMEDYDAPGHFHEASDGEYYARIQAEAYAWQYRVCKGICDVRTMACGVKFKLDKHPVAANNREYMVIAARHRLLARGKQQSDERNQDREQEDASKMELEGQLDFGKDYKDNYRCQFEVIPSEVQYRSVRKTRWPRIAGFLTAIVTGPSGEEIYTDEHGRIKVQFHWDREGRNDENTTCFIRVVTPWSGRNWGMVAIPRIGQEVMVQFEDGDPDRPIVTGMLYNADTMPPYGLPDNMTQQGIKTNSSKGGNGFNELMFEDMKDSELVRFQAEKDYEQIVKNNATITIGLEKRDPGDLTQEVHNDVTETIGNNETRDIGNDVTETIGNNETRDIGNNQDETIGTNQTVSVGQNITIDAGMNIEITAGMKILLKVGGSSIKIDNMGITIKGPMVNIKADTLGEFKAGAVLTLKGGLTMIN